MKIQLSLLLLLALTGAAAAQEPARSAATQTPAKPIRTGNEWKMPGDVLQRSGNFANTLKKNLHLDSVQTAKVYNAYLANTKSVDEISVLPNEEEKKARMKENKAAFNDTLKTILTPAQYQKYLQTTGK